MDDSDDEVEEEVGEEEVGEVLEPRPPPPPTPPEVPKKPSYVIEAACKKFEVPQEAVLFSAYRPVAVKDGALMGSITASNSPAVWTAAGVSWKHLVRVGWTIDDVIFEGIFVTFSSQANPDSSDPRILRRITTSPTKQFVSELASLGEKASIKYKNLCLYNIDSPKLVSSFISNPITCSRMRAACCVWQDPVAARFRQLSKDEADKLTVDFRSKPKASPAVGKKAPPAPPPPEPSDEEAPATTNGKRVHSGNHISLNIDSHCLIPRDLFEQLYKDSIALKKLKARSQ